jgi:DNA repair exonuclease SbcCD nuclease subunit
VTTSIAHLADLHLGFNALPLRTPSGQNLREHDVERAALACADLIADELRPQIAVIAGDLLDATRVSTRGFDGAVRFCRRLREAGIEVVVVGGNHDQAEGEESFPMLSLLARHHDVRVYLGQATLDISGVRLHLVPFRALSRALSGRGEIEPFEFSNLLPNVLVCHGAVDAPQIAAEEVLVPPEWLNDPRFALCALGHIHQHRQLNERSFYSGAIEHLSFGERNETPGFWLHTLDNGALASSRSIKVDQLGIDGVPRPMRQLSVDASGKTLEQLDAEVRASFVEVKGALWKLQLSDVGAAFTRSRLRSDWQQAFRAQGGLLLDVSVEARRISELLDGQELPELHDGRDALLAYVGAQSFESESRRTRTIELAEQVIDAAREKLATQEA